MNFRNNDLQLFIICDGMKEVQIQKTQVVKNTLNPIFNEIFSFRLDDTMKDSKLKFEVNKDRFLCKVDRYTNLLHKRN